MATAPDQLSEFPRVTVRPMLEADVRSIIDIERSAYPFPWSEGIFRDCIRVGYTCRVLDLDGQVIGYGVMSVGAGEAHILNLCVREEFRSVGFGRRLLDYMLDRGAAAGMTEAFLEVRPSNLSAIRLYTSMGFEQVGVRRGYYQAAAGREDAAVLRLVIRGRKPRAG